MNVKEAMEFILDQGFTKYKIAKVMGMQPIMVDKFIKEQQKTIRREAAEALLTVWNIEIDDHCINGFTTKDFKRKHYQSEMYVNEDDNSLRT